MRAVRADLGILACLGADDVDLRALSGLTARHEEHAATVLRVTTGDQPFFDRLRAGATAVTTAARVYTPGRWHGAQFRARLVRHWGVREVVAVPVRGRVRTTAVLIGRDGLDFDEDELRLLTELQPVVSALVAILDLDSLPTPTARLVRLTEREDSILKLLSQGLTASRMARLAGCSPRTVHHHLASIYAKLDVGDRLSAVNRARELGLVDGDTLLLT
ncbi:DNA-binding response regulator [Ornithinimicrobium avium]|uniref:DNA-binding response regulator n=1 Tax=Ornithinimicrobium avium TaxID=2283195 RepID=A0A345NKJ7_9MICO|nr:DNA-binding response regulator [Ornithinimicrobium avium]